MQYGKPYTELSERTKRRRVVDLLEYARKISFGGEIDTKELVSDAAGSYNRTNSSIGRMVEKIQGEGRNSDDGCGKIIALLQHVTDSGCREDAVLSGCKAGRKMWTKAKKDPMQYVKSGISARTERRGQGRKVTVDLGRIREEWVKRAGDGGDINESMSRVAREIAKLADCKWRQALRWKPDWVGKKKSPNALCGVCELLRKRRLLSMGMDKPTGDGFRSVRKMWENSESRKSAPEDVVTLEKHEKAVEFLKKKYESDKLWSSRSLENRVCIFDYASAPTLKSNRGTGYDFNSKITVTYFGAMVFASGGKTYHHVLDFRKKTGGHTAHHSFSCAKKVFSSPEFLGGFSLKDLSIRTWTDTASNFRSREFTGSLLDVECKSVRVSYHAEEHGKTSLDSIFTTGKAAIQSVDADGCSDVENFVQKVRSYLHCNSSGTNHIVHHLVDDCEVETSVLVLPDKIQMSIPYFWERKNRIGSFPELYIDLSEEATPLVTSAASDTPGGSDPEEDVLLSFQGKRPSGDTIISRISTKYSKSTLFK